MGIRGFKNRGIGPNEETYAQGGETFLRASAGYRFPLISSHASGSTEPFEVLRGEIFIDAGVLDPDAFALDFSEVRASTGLSLSLMIFPQVPITFSFGFPLIDGEDDDKRVFNFAIGFN
jgi:outer membrane protein assembly factor BamA